MPSGLFADSIVTRVATPEMWLAPLHPREAGSVRHAVPRRQREFAAGRACARDALASFGLGSAVIAADPDRVPVWPDGIVGSISHADGLCAAVVARSHEWAGIGLDVERADPLAPDLTDLVSAAAELDEASRRSGLGEGLAAKVLFSAKEAVFKCFYPATRAWWDFRDVTIRLDGPGIWTAILPPRGSSAPWPDVVNGRVAVRGGWILTGTAQRRDAPPAVHPGAMAAGEREGSG